MVLSDIDDYKDVTDKYFKAFKKILETGNNNEPFPIAIKTLPTTYTLLAGDKEFPLIDAKIPNEDITNIIDEKASIYLNKITSDTHLSIYTEKSHREKTLLTFTWDEFLHIKPKLIAIFNNMKMLVEGREIRDKEKKKAKYIDVLKKSITLDDYTILLYLHKIEGILINMHIAEKHEHHNPVSISFRSACFDILRERDFWSLYKKVLKNLEVELDENFDDKVRDYLTTRKYAKIPTQFSNNVKFNKYSRNSSQIELFDDNKDESIEIINEKLYNNIQFIDLTSEEWEVMFELFKLSNEQKLGIKQNYISFKSVRDLFPEKSGRQWDVFKELAEKPQQLVSFYKNDGEDWHLTGKTLMFELWYNIKGKETKKINDNIIPDSYVIKFHSVILRGFKGGGCRYLPYSLKDDLKTALPKIGMKRLQPLHYKFALWLFTHEYKGTPIKRSFDKLTSELHLKNKKNKLSKKQIQDKLIGCAELLKESEYIKTYEIGQTCIFHLNTNKIYHLDK